MIKLKISNLFHFVFLLLFTTALYAIGVTHFIKNTSSISVWISMDTCREEHQVPPNGNIAFVKANSGDRPTFHVRQKEYCCATCDKTNNPEIGSMKVGAGGSIDGGSYTWDGSSLHGKKSKFHFW